jgi:hypothetical protein
VREHLVRNSCQLEKSTVAPGRLPRRAKYLEGRWALQSFEVRPPGKAPIFPKGSGSLNYDDFGNMRMEIRADEASSDLLRAAGINIRDGVISSDGRTVIDLQNHTLTYFIEGQPSSTTTGGGPLATNKPRTGSHRRRADADDQGRQRRSAVDQQVEETVDRRGDKACALRRS